MKFIYKDDASIWKQISLSLSILSVLQLLLFDVFTVFINNRNILPISIIPANSYSFTALTNLCLFLRYLDITIDLNFKKAK